MPSAFEKGEFIGKAIFFMGLAILLVYLLVRMQKKKK
jgi:hypothetical protein